MILAFGAPYFILPLLATFEFSLRMGRGELPSKPIASSSAIHNFPETFLYSVTRGGG